MKSYMNTKINNKWLNSIPKEVKYDMVAGLAVIAIWRLLFQKIRQMFHIPNL